MGEGAHRGRAEWKARLLPPRIDLEKKRVHSLCKLIILVNKLLFINCIGRRLNFEAGLRRAGP